MFIWHSLGYLASFQCALTFKNVHIPVFTINTKEEEMNLKENSLLLMKVQLKRWRKIEIEKIWKKYNSSENDS